MEDWLAPRSIEHDLFKLATKWNLNVHEALPGDEWMKGLNRIGLHELLDQLVSNLVQLHELYLSTTFDAILDPNFKCPYYVY